MSEPTKTKIPAEFESSVQGGDSPKSQAEINADILVRLTALEGG